VTVGRNLGICLYGKKLPGFSKIRFEGVPGQEMVRQFIVADTIKTPNMFPKDAAVA
jgi:hypothetical protein